MEKAFDRVSYKFLNKALATVGYGPNFRKLVAMMYNEDDAPKRRIYANGYYSEWFDIKSGVAQGCPLSPLLFLLVAESLKKTLDADPGIKGITIGKREYKISQFADDTTLLLKNLKSYKPALKAVDRWGKATGMRENKKREKDSRWGNTEKTERGKNFPKTRNGWRRETGRSRWETR